MVLGANLKPMKKGAMDTMFNGIYDPRGAYEGNINPLASFDAKNNFK